MSMADEIFINMCRDILENGTSTEGEVKDKTVGAVTKAQLEEKIKALL